MSLHTRTVVVEFAAMQYTSDLVSKFNITDVVERELPNMDVYDASVIDASEFNPFRRYTSDVPLLVITERHYDSDGDRSNFQHPLRLDEWLVQSRLNPRSDESAYTVMSNDEFQEFINSSQAVSSHV